MSIPALKTKKTTDIIMPMTFGNKYKNQKSRMSCRTLGLARLGVALACSVFALAAIMSPVALAQDSIPTISVPKLEKTEERPEAFQGAVKPFLNIQNAYFTDAIRLQYQISLMQQLLQWHSQINKLKVAYDSIGHPFLLPKPPQNICKELPRNMICVHSYPDLYPDEDGNAPFTPGLDPSQNVFLDPIDNPELRQARVISASLPVDNVVPQRQEPVPALAAVKPPKPSVNYQWSNISCALGKCKAVVTDGSYRQTIRAGDKLIDDAVVKKISVDGVIVTKDGEEIMVGPAPANIDTATPATLSSFDGLPPAESLDDLPSSVPEDELLDFPGGEGGNIPVTEDDPFAR